MRIRHRFRVGLLTAVVGVLFVAGLQPASASIFSQTKFTGTLTLQAGINYPCSPATTPNTQKCPFPTAPKPAPWGNVRSFGLSSSVCVSNNTWINKFGSTITARTGNCFVSISGSIKLDCILGDGVATGTISHTPVVGTPTFTNFTATITHVGGQYVVNGTGTEGGLPGILTGTFSALPDVTAGGSCVNKTQVRFIVTGGFVFTTLNT